MMKTAKSLLLGILAGAVLFLPCRASAVDDQWKYVTSTDKGARCFYDAASVIPLGKDVKEVRTREIGSDGSAASSLEEVDCANKIVREREVIIESRNKPPQVSHELGDWRAMELDPVMSQLFKALCR
ncbi:MAG: hypothetical protein M0Z67_18435 [Nitrospiraceae bacterium]|nr:hypothetical protein [Nitrospiraceae bacterium]